MAASREALRAAARIFADAIRKHAGVVSRQTAAAVNISEGGGSSIEVNAGHPGGPWGWEPIQGWMFETGASHPLFGDKGHWYPQRHYPFLEIGTREALDRAADAYADIEIDRLLAEYGWI